MQLQAMDRNRELPEVIFDTAPTPQEPSSISGGGDRVQEIMFMVYEYAAISEGITRAEGEARRTQLAAMREKANTIRASLTPTSEAAP